MKQEFNIIITGVGGQGIITLLQVLAEAALLQGFEVRTSELHGLSQREGSVSTHLRFGKKIFSPLIIKGKADLILALETTEALRTAEFAHKNTIFLINKKHISYLAGPSEQEILKLTKKLPGDLYFINASNICQQEFGKEVLAGIYLLGLALKKDLIPLKENNILKAIKKTVAEKYFSLNKKGFKMACKDAEKT